MLGENLLAKFKQTPLAITAMRALKGEERERPTPLCISFLCRVPRSNALCVGYGLLCVFSHPRIYHLDTQKSGPACIVSFRLGHRARCTKALTLGLTPIHGRRIMLLSIAFFFFASKTRCTLSSSANRAVNVNLSGARFRSPNPSSEGVNSRSSRDLMKWKRMCCFDVTHLLYLEILGLESRE